MTESSGVRGRRSRRPAVAVIGAVSIALLAGGCTAETVATPSDESTTVAWTSCGERLECATVPVPLDWGDVNGETIDLAVIKHAASKPDQKIGTIFTDPGGPGDTGVGFVKDAGDELDGWGDGRFDWIGWDPRGTYGSTPVKCFRTDAEEAEFWDGVRVRPRRPSLRHSRC
ncbi:hypothetical protein [Glaciibacter superstes]|uniref:hypothetical protein n=1 Tax=Glaciibacter superstes TaxID=501023 RepID=UPI001B7FD5B9|nr:hypothetical protein [Glaciibacter superstes]